MGEGRRIEGWKLPADAREELLAIIPPRYEQVVADHVTFKPGPEGAPMPDVDHGLLIGRADDGEGVEALILSLDGTADRPDGSTWHITWSLAEGRRAKESNDVIARLGWTPITPRRRVPLEPGWWVWLD